MTKSLKIVRQNLNSKSERNVPARVMSFTSGKGGMGKTHLVTNTAVSLSKLGRRILILDADLGLANIDILFGLQVEHTIHDYFENRISLQDLIVEGPEGVDIIPASSGVESILHLSQQERFRLLSDIEEIAQDYDYLLIDTPAGIGPDVLSFAGASQEIVCIISSEPTSLTDAYALIKVLSRRFGERKIQIIVNSASNEMNAEHTFHRFDEVVQQYLQVELQYLGWVARDEAVTRATRQQRPFVLEYPSSQAALAVNRITNKMDTEFFGARIKGGMQFFFQKILETEVYGSEQL